MSDFQLHTPETAPEASKLALKQVKGTFGAIPNLHATLAESPQTLQAYGALWQQFSESTFSPVEQQVVYLTSNFENDCHYCMAGHTGLAKQAGMNDETIEALREGQTLPDPKLNALSQFTRTVVTQRGWVDEAGVQAFLDAGYSRQNILEVVLGVATKVISNYTNHFADTPLDSFMQSAAWTHPDKR